MKKNFSLILVLLFLSTFLLGCNTLRGAGEDVEEATDTVADTVDDDD